MLCLVLVSSLPTVEAQVGDTRTETSAREHSHKSKSTLCEADRQEQEVSKAKGKARGEGDDLRGQARALKLLLSNGQNFWVDTVSVSFF